jgi:hypothetical protein
MDQEMFVAVVGVEEEWDYFSSFFMVFMFGCSLT